MDMPPERIDVAFSIFDIDGELKITLSSVMNFVQHALKQVSEDEETDKTEETEETEEEEEEEEEEDSLFHLPSTLTSEPIVLGRGVKRSGAIEKTSSV